jgi:hypothetical protein
VGIYYYLLGGLDRCWGEQSTSGVDLTTVGQPDVKIIYVVGGGVYIYSKLYLHIRLNIYPCVAILAQAAHAWYSVKVKSPPARILRDQLYPTRRVGFAGPVFFTSC